ncbi:hypothetical protein CLU79DRAFT_766882 [Phycomyces nitens]|nr:hypothetical protein CLU79DRAFT_766882 [Phycomyces nitens]
MASRLPVEIILKIAQHLLTEDKIACSLTCKAWRAPFQEIVFTNIKVDSIQELEDICEIVKHPKTESVPYDQIVNGRI